MRPTVRELHDRIYSTNKGIQLHQVFGVDFYAKLNHVVRTIGYSMGLGQHHQDFYVIDSSHSIPRRLGWYCIKELQQ